MILPTRRPRSSSFARTALLAEALRPAVTSDQWQQAAPPDEKALSGIRRLDCLDAQSEAQSIALLMREDVGDGG